MNLVFICDNNYALPTRTAINSVIRNKKTETELKIYVVAVDLSPENIKKFKTLATHNVSIEVIEKTNSFAHVGLDHIYVSKAALFKFSLPELLPDDKVLYLDGDIIVQEDLSGLYNTNISGHYVAAVKDMAGMVLEKHHIRLNHHNYFNSGVMLLNLKKMREDNITEKLLDAKRKDTLGHFMDQDALNLVFNENIVYLPPIYNFMAANLTQFSTDEIKNFYNTETLASPVIMHLTNVIKPWNNISATNSELWLQYVLPEDLGCVLKNYFHNLNIDDLQDINENIKRLSYENKRLNEKIKKLQKSKISARCKRLLKKLFYKNKNNKKKFRLFGIPLCSLKKQPGKKVFKILGIKFSFKDKVDK